MKHLKNITQKKHKGHLKKVEEFNKVINDNLDMSSEKSEIINKLIELNRLIQIYNLNRIDNNLKQMKKWMMFH